MRAICLANNAGRTLGYFLPSLPIYRHHTPELLNERRPPLCLPLSPYFLSNKSSHLVIHESHYDSNVKFQRMSKTGLCTNRFIPASLGTGLNMREKKVFGVPPFSLQ